MGTHQTKENTFYLIVMYKEFQKHLTKELQEIKDAGLYKNERVITTPQSSAIGVESAPGEVLNFCANNYLGLADNARLIEAATKAMKERGYGMSSVRFICGTQDLHDFITMPIPDVEPVILVIARHVALESLSIPVRCSPHACKACLPLHVVSFKDNVVVAALLIDQPAAYKIIHRMPVKRPLSGQIRIKAVIVPCGGRQRKWSRRLSKYR